MSDCTPMPEALPGDAVGDGWILRCGDCLDPETGLASIGQVDAFISDPPFDAHTHSRGGNVIRHDGGPDIAKIPFAALERMDELAAAIASACRRWAVIFCADKQIGAWNDEFKSHDWRESRCVAWVKPDGSPQFSGDRPGHGWESIVCAHPKAKSHWNGGGHKGVYTFNRIDRASGFLHPTQKPLLLMEALVLHFTDPGEVVCDPFSGSGTTAVACLKHGRRFIGWEKDPEFFDVAVRRIQGRPAKVEGQEELFG